MNFSLVPVVRLQDAMALVPPPLFGWMLVVHIYMPPITSGPPYGWLTSVKEAYRMLTSVKLLGVGAAIK